MEKLNFDKITLRKFAIQMGIVFLVIASLFYIKHREVILPIAILSGLFFLSASISPLLLKPLYYVWMKFTAFMGWLITSLILAVIFYLIFTPIGLLMRCLKKDPLDLKIEKSKPTYWQIKVSKEYNPLDYEKQF
ncbi:MAG: hypothetical protein DRP74_05420 [Candidatus Omnitrophota bacterium]|nr:MAG: hypothetical protein DRP74_05420 [Candidatus Omnitrophota bacterium]